MNPSRIFIERPVAHLAADGRRSCWWASSPTGSCRCRRCREVDYPTIRVLTLYPGASPEVMTSSVTAPLERQFGQMPGLNQMTSTSSAGASVDHPAVRPQARPRRRRAAGPGGDQRRRQPAAVRPARAADLRQGQPGRRADPDAGRHLQDRAADQGPRHGRHAARPEDLAAPRRRPGQPRGRPEARRAHPRQSDGARRLRPQHRRPAHHDLQRQRQHAQGQFRRPGARLHHQRQRPDHRPRDFQRHRRRLSQRRAGAAVRRRDRRGGAGEQPARRLDERRPRR